MNAHDNVSLAAKVTPGVNLIRGDSVLLESVQWLWPGYLPLGMLTILGGSPGCGKTTIALSLAALVTKGARWPCGAAQRAPGDVLIWSGEDPHSILAARLAAANADMKRVHFVDGTREVGAKVAAFDPATDMVLLEAAAQRVEAPRLLILDPIVSAVAGDSHKNAETRRALQPVLEFAKRLDCAVIGITHFTKGTAGRDPVERITGSLAFAAVARVVLIAAKPRPEPGVEIEPPRLLMRAKSNVGPDDGGFAYELDLVEVAPGVEGQRARWGRALDGTARELLSDAEGEAGVDAAGAELRTSTDEAMDRLREILAGPGPVLGSEAKKLMAEYEFTPKVTRRAREKLDVKITRVGAGTEARSYWSLPYLPSIGTQAPMPTVIARGTSGQEFEVTGTSQPEAHPCEVF